MRPDDRRASMAGFEPDAGPVPLLDADLAPLDEELAAAGRQARHALHGSTQPTRAFSASLRDRLVGAADLPAAAAAGAFAGSTIASREPAGLGARIRAGSTPGEAWAPRPLEPRVARRTPTPLPRARWSLLAAAALTGVVVVGALGARLDWLVPSPTVGPTASPNGPERTPGPTVFAVLPGLTPAPTSGVVSTPVTAEATAKPAPTPTKKPGPTPKPEPTLPPIVPMELAAKACPGGVVLDWTKPSPAVGHYHALRSLDGDVAAAYPAPGATEIDSATSWSAGITDGFDASLDGSGTAATYRVFAFDGSDHLLAYSPSMTITTLAVASLGTLGVVENGPGSITVSWSGASLPDGCFTYGKLVASAEDPDPSYLKGSPYLAVIGDAGQTSVTLDGLASGTTVWTRYELIRGTGTGKFVVGRSAVLQVTYP